MDLKVYSDADLAGCPDTRRSTFGYAVPWGQSVASHVFGQGLVTLMIKLRINSSHEKALCE